MAKPLVIVESGAKAKTIVGFLGADSYTVMASVGHIRDLPRGAKYAPKSVTKPEVRRLGIDVDDHFTPIYVVPDDKKQVVSQLKAALKDASELYLATDEDREGEAISWHLLEVLKPRVPVKRMVFHEITSEAIEDAIENWRDLDMKLVEAQEGRRTLDRLVRLRGLERRVPPHRSRHARPAECRASRRVSSSTASAPAWRSAAVRTGISKARFARHRHRAAAFPATLDDARRQAPRVGSRLRRRHRSAQPERRRRAARRGRRGRARRRASRTSRSPSSSVETRAHTERPEGAVHHVDAAAGGGPQARLQLGAHHARRPGPLRAGPHHLHADRLHLALRAGGRARPATRSAACTARPTSPTSPASTAAR